MRLGDFARRAAMAQVGAVDLRERVHGFLERSKAEQPLAVRQIRACARVLNDGRLSAREVAHGAVADPRVLEGYAGRLGRAELPARALDVPAVALRASSDVPGVPHAPPVPLQARPIRCICIGLLAAGLTVRVAVGPVQGALQRLGRGARGGPKVWK